MCNRMIPIIHSFFIAKQTMNFIQQTKSPELFDEGFAEQMGAVSNDAQHGARDHWTTDETMPKSSCTGTDGANVTKTVHKVHIFCTPSFSEEDNEVNAELLAPLESEDLDRLPEMLKPMLIQYGMQSAERCSMLALAQIGVLSGMMPNVEMVKDGKLFFPNLALIISAPPASGKGSILHAKLFAKGIDDRLYHEYLNSVGADGASTAKMRSLLAPGNSSNAAFTKMLAENKGRLLMVESEMKAMLSMLRNPDFGLSRETLLMALEHETISVARVTDNSICKIDKPKLSIVLSGVPNDVHDFLGRDGIGSGLLSRCIFFVLNRREEYQMWGLTDNEDLTAEEVLAQPIQMAEGIFYCLSNRKIPLRVKLASVQKVKLYQWLAPLNDNGDIAAAMGEEILSVFKRMEVHVGRIAMVLTVIRIYETEGSGVLSTLDSVEVQDEDFNLALAIGKMLLDHCQYIYMANKNSEADMRERKSREQVDALMKGVKLTKRKRLIVNLLSAGNSFTRKKFQSIAATAGYCNQRSLHRLWTELRNDGKILPVPDTDGHYCVAEGVFC